MENLEDSSFIIYTDNPFFLLKSPSIDRQTDIQEDDQESITDMSKTDVESKQRQPLSLEMNTFNCNYVNKLGTDRFLSDKQAQFNMKPVSKEISYHEVNKCNQPEQQQHQKIQYNYNQYQNQSYHQWQINPQPIYSSHYIYPQAYHQDQLKYTQVNQNNTFNNHFRLFQYYNQNIPSQNSYSYSYQSYAKPIIHQTEQIPIRKIQMSHIEVKTELKPVIDIQPKPNHEVITVIESLFTFSYLNRDIYFKSVMDENGWIPLDTIMSISSMKRMKMTSHQIIHELDMARDKTVEIKHTHQGYYLRKVNWEDFSKGMLSVRDMKKAKLNKKQNHYLIDCNITDIDTNNMKNFTNSTMKE